MANASEPTLARLAFWVSPDRQTEFETVYERDVLPILHKHGFRESSEVGHPTIASVFSRMFEFENPSEGSRKGMELAGDPAWAATMKELAVTFGNARPWDGAIRHTAMPHRAPAGRGTDSVVGAGSPVPAGHGKGHWQTYDVDALLHIQDREDNLWFGSKGGAIRFDGLTWTRFDVIQPHNSIVEIFEDRSGQIWFGGYFGVIRYDPSADPLPMGSTSPRSIQYAADGAIHDTPTSADVFTKFTQMDRLVETIIQDRRGDLWLGGSGVRRYDGKTFRTFTVDDGLALISVRRIFEDHSGNLWFGYWEDAGITRYDGRNWRTFTSLDGLPDNTVNGIGQDKNGILWLSTAKGLSRYDGTRWSNVSDLSGRILQDRQGNLLIDGQNGLSRNDGTRWTAHAQDSGAGSPGRLRLQDREGHLWFSLSRTSGSSVSRYGGATFSTFTTEDGLGADNVMSIFQDRRGDLWFGTRDGGVSRYDGKTFTTFTDDDGLAGNRVNAIFQDRSGDLWFGTMGGVSRFDGHTMTTFTTDDGLPNDATFSIFQDSSGDHWFGTGSGVTRYDGETFTSFSHAEGVTLGRGGEIFQDRSGDLWFCDSESGGGDPGAIRYDGKRFTPLTTEDGLISNRVVSMLQDRTGTYWYGTPGYGLSHFSPTEGTSGRGNWSTLTAEDGLASNYVHSIYEDRNGHIWFSPKGNANWTIGNGVSRYDGQVIQTLTREDGLADNQVTVVYQDRDNVYWIGTTRGLTRYKPPSPVPPKVYVDAVVVDRRHEGVSEVSIPSTVGVTAFEFRAMSFKTRPDGIVYRYRLSGHEEDWRSTRERRIEYQDLPQGSYTFEVVAIDRDLVYSDNPAIVALTVHPPFERIGWMSGLGIALILVIWQTTRVLRRDRSLRDSNKALSDANHELFGLNVELQQDRAVARLRAEIQSMESTEDFETVLTQLAADLKTAGLVFDTCEIDVLDEPVDEPNTQHFETQGFCYTTYRVEQSGTITDESFNVPAPFPGVVKETIERFVEGKPWRGTSENRAIIEVPASRYGRLRIVSSNRDSFSDEDLGHLEPFAAAIALGYARYLDIREIQLQTERKSAFLASMSHELRTPMNAIKGFTNMVLRRAGDVLPDRQKENLQKVDQASDHLLAMINDLLDLSKIEAGRMDVSPEVFDVAELIKSCCDTVSPLVQDGVELSHEVADDVGEANTDRARLQQMVINLLSNAIKFTDSGRVTVTSAREQGAGSRGPDVPDPGVSAEAPGAKEGSRISVLAISVSDTGKGIPAEELPTLFDEYRQVEGQSDSDVQKGTGLGLSITKKFAELLGGSISVESEVGKGTTFAITIPSTYSM